MSADIGSGDFVESLYTVGPEAGCIGIETGAVYRVRATVADRTPGTCGHRFPFGVCLVGDDPRAARWCPCTFRPIYKPSASLIRDLLEPTKEDA